MMEHPKSGRRPETIPYGPRGPAVPTRPLRRGGTARHAARLAMAVMAAGTLWLTTPARAAQSLWSPSDVPARITDSDTGAVELGVRFRSAVPGTVTGIRFYKGPRNLGTHTGSLWTAGGTRLATGTFVNESPSGWQTLLFAAPVVIAANTTYVASYRAPNGQYSVSNGYFATARSNGVLTAPASGTRGNGVYRYGASGFPSQSYQASNYWVDVIFEPSGTDNVAPSAPGGLAGSAVSPSEVSLRWSAASDNLGVAGYGVYRDGVLVATAAGTSFTVGGLTAGASYAFAVDAVDAAGNRSVKSGSVTVATPSTTAGGATVATVGTNRDLLVNGRKFFPLCVYHAGYAESAALGFNCLQYWFNRTDTTPGAVTLAEMQDGLNRGVMTVVEYSDYVRSGNIANMRTMADRLKGQPGIIANYAVDEPHYTAGMSLATVRAACDALAQVDPNRPCFVLEERTAILDYVQAAPILGMDHYPVRWTGTRYGFPGQTTDSLASIGRMLDEVRAAAPTKPIWFAVQTHRIPSDSAYPDPARYPTTAELRVMAYLALNHGATGLWFYARDDVYGSFQSGFAYSPTLMSYLPQLLSELRGMGERYTYGAVTRLNSGSEVDMVSIAYQGVTTVVAINPTGRTLSGNVPGLGSRGFAPLSVTVDPK